MKNNFTTSINTITLVILAVLFVPMQPAMAQLSFHQTNLPGSGLSLSPDDNTEKKDNKKRKDEFKIYIGANFNQLNIADERYYSNMGIGWDVGFKYKRGRFFYWEIGALFNNPVYVVRDNQVPADSMDIFDGTFGVRQIDIPFTGGINFLSVTSRIVGIRVFVSAIPSFNIGVGSNDYGLTKDDLNSFNFYGQAGVGVDIAFIFIEGAFNFGAMNIFENDFQSNPYQLQVNLGFRF